MNIILFTRAGGRAGSIHLGRPQCYLPLLLGCLLFCGMLVYGGYWLASVRHAPVEAVAASAPEMRWQAELQAQQAALDAARLDADAHLNALAQRLGQMQAQLLRIDALGERLAKMADLDAAEFNFDLLPAQGGPEAAIDLPDTEMPDFLQALDALQAQLDDRQRKLKVLENLVLDQNLEEQIQPAGRPISKGWVSSYFGKRTDPFTGKPAIHKGMDFAGTEGSDVVAVAAGVVTWAGSRYGYGKLVEINHGNGYVTRYGHGKEVLVAVGDKVEKGQVIALMGSSGRSTGPHVHFEVLRNGQEVNPQKYIQAAR